MKNDHSSFTYRLFALFFILIGSMQGYSISYFISNAGNDSNDGTTTETPWQTLAKVDSRTFFPGDQILFKCGDTFYGSLTISSSGSAGNPITFGAYGIGENPVITGFTSVTTWTDLGSNIWESTDAVSTLSTCNMVVVDGVNTAMGRWPNADAPNGGYLNIDSNTATSITSSSLSGTPNWTGAEGLVKEKSYLIRRADIVSQSGSTINLNAVDAIDNYGFFIQDDVRTLDQQNEWYYNPSTKKIKIFSTSQPTDIKVASVQDVMTINAHWISVDNLSFTGSNRYLFYNTDSKPKKSHIDITNCDLRFSGSNSIRMGVHYLKIENCNISESNNGGVFSTVGQHVTIRNNIVSNIAQLIGMISDGYKNGIQTYIGRDVLIEYNSIRNVGYCGIGFYGDSIVVKNNFIDTYCNVFDDGGGIYSYTGERASMTMAKIIGNIVLNGAGNQQGTSKERTATRGIYLDWGSKNVEVAYNTVYNSKLAGIYHCSRGNINVHHNTVLDGGEKSFYSTFWNSAKVVNDTAPTNNRLNNNIFFARYITGTGSTAKGKCAVYYITKKLPNTPQQQVLFSIAEQDSNFYYRKKYDRRAIQYNHSDYTPGFCTFEEWKIFSGFDTHSVYADLEDPAAIQFEYNASKTNKTISLSRPMVDVKGKKYATIVTLLPYTSVILMPDPNPAKQTTEYKSICEGEKYYELSTTGKYERTLTSKTGQDSIVVTYLAVNPNYSVIESIEIRTGENYNDWTESGQYIRNLKSASGCDSIVTTNLSVAFIDTKQAEPEYTQTIVLKKGYNLISAYVSPQNPIFNSVVQSLTDAGSLLKIQDEAGNSFENWGDPMGWVNNLGSIQATEGYKIILENDCSLQLTGKLVVLPLTISLSRGWNFISFPLTDQVDAMSVIRDLMDQNQLVKVQDEQGNSIENWGAFGGWNNDIGNFLPGKAYKIKMNSNAELIYLQNYPKSSVIPVLSDIPDFFLSNVEGNGTDHMNINLVGLNESGITVGDELAAFDGERCVGVVKISADHLISGTASLISSYSTNEEHSNGFTEGNSIRILVWNKLSSKETRVQFDILAGDPVFTRNASVMVRLKSLTTSANYTDIQKTSAIFPNPSNGNFTVRLNDISQPGSRIEVIDSLGRMITTRNITNSSQDFSLVNPTSGLYLVKIIQGSNQEIQKLIIN
jgi:hypothetical protein